MMGRLLVGVGRLHGEVGGGILDKEGVANVADTALPP